MISNRGHASVPHCREEETHQHYTLGGCKFPKRLVMAAWVRAGWTEVWLESL